MEAGGVPAGAPVAAPPKRSSPLKWILVGCGCITGVGVLGFAGCFGVAWWFVQKAVKDVEPAAVAYLCEQPEATELFGAIAKAEANIIGSNVRMMNSGGTAIINLSVTGSAASGTAVISLTRTDGVWRGVGCSLQAGGKTTTTGEQLQMPSRSSDWDD